ncbi:hypothetical protein J7E81_22200 [Bacillus sp. ISL-18]|uniref:CBO0543 family protein n=1 Tax=Bacillus sp. ISL-18 TaxID=2819118 RepID=UPI001BE5E869|nr:CBO0543 family protein [Bacillus sp. ISL-18]MBT2657919.1 hypothetical protein [Bacillus sp. ISL-18]
MHIIGQFLWIFAAWRWGDWRNWRNYQSTLLFMIVFSLLYDVLSYNYSLWIFSDFILPTHTLNSLAVTFIGFPCSVLLFLSRFPKNNRIKQLIYVSFWVVLYIAIEYFFVVIGLFHYYHGWNIWWSALLDATLFPMLLLHHKKPLAAYIISVPIIIFYFLFFNLPISKMK